MAVAWGIAFAMLGVGSQVAHADFLNASIQPNSNMRVGKPLPRV